MDILSRDQFSRSIRGKWPRFLMESEKPKQYASRLHEVGTVKEVVIMVKLDDIAIF